VWETTRPISNLGPTWKYLYSTWAKQATIWISNDPTNQWISLLSRTLRWHQIQKWTLLGKNEQINHFLTLFILARHIS
jgi:hypothetical protein